MAQGRSPRSSPAPSRRASRGSTRPATARVAGAYAGSYWRGSWVRRRRRRLARMVGRRRAAGPAVPRREVHEWPPLERLGSQPHRLRPLPLRRCRGDRPEGLRPRRPDPGAPPLEYVTGSCTDTDYLAVFRAAAGGGSAGDVLEFQVNGTGLEYWSNPHSAAVPAADSSSRWRARRSARSTRPPERSSPATAPRGRRMTTASSPTSAPRRASRASPTLPAASTGRVRRHPSPRARPPWCAAPDSRRRRPQLKTWLLHERLRRSRDGWPGQRVRRRGAAPAPATRLEHARRPSATSLISRRTQGTPKGPIAFTVDDDESAAGSLTVSGTSSNQTLVPNASIAFGGSGASRTVTVTPAAGQAGQHDDHDHRLRRRPDR